MKQNPKAKWIKNSKRIAHDLLEANPFAAATRASRNKLRGQKRLSKTIDCWKAENLAYDETAVDEYGYDYCRLRLDPYYRLIRRTPSRTIKKQIFKAFIDVLRSWEEQVSTDAKDRSVFICADQQSFIEIDVIVRSEKFYLRPGIQFAKRTSRKPEGMPYFALAKSLAPQVRWHEECIEYQDEVPSGFSGEMEIKTFKTKYWVGRFERTTRETFTTRFPPP